MLRILLALSLFIVSGLATAKVGAGDTAASRSVILVMGDSLSAGYGLAQHQAWPALLAKRLQAENRNFTVNNASISGETSAGGRTRLAATLDRVKPTVLVLALGANDGLRGLPSSQLRDNLRTMVQAAKARHIRVLLIGMRLPPNYGRAYTDEFFQSFETLAKKEKVALLPFLLEPVADDRSNFQADGLHPVAEAQAKILDHIWPALLPLLKSR